MDRQIIKLTPHQKLAIQQLANNNYSFGIGAVTLRSLLRRGLIKQTGDWYYCLTEKGVSTYYQIVINRP